MPFNEKDFVLVEYTATVKETGSVVDTTSSEIAKANNIFDEEKLYEPILIVIGEGRVVKGLEETIKEMNEGEEKEVEIPPEKAYGVRDPSKLRRIPLREFRKGEVEPIPGRIVEINGVPAVIRDVSGGRVLVDFNHPLAGKVLVYKVKVVKQLKTDEEKIRALLKRRFRAKEPEKYGIRISKEEGLVEIKVPEQEMLGQDIQLAKRALAREIFEYIEGIGRVLYVEEVVKQKEEKMKTETAKAEGAKEEQTQQESSQSSPSK
ncbi:MAG: FKBP-type peptidyl-prolyl cis-trans isomerase [Fervidicoccaceae archaeon]